jgi:hypothetical protein
VKLRSFIEKCGVGGTVTIPCFTCAHCNCIVEMPTRDTPAGFCQKCFYPTCLACGGTERCTPFEKRIEAYEKRMRFRAQMGV